LNMMKRDVSFMQYMRAHGNTPGPTQRPALTGAIGGALALIPAAAVRWRSGAFASAAEASGLHFWQVLAVDACVMIIAGVIYAQIFKRAANDKQGGWLFGIGYGFLLWMLGPVTFWQFVTGRPLALGYAAMGLFGSQILYGLTLGIIYPRIHSLIQTKLR
jgi:hypothetical protein